MKNSKACRDTDIPTKIIKENADIFADILLASFKYSVEKITFPSSLKKAIITPVFKKGDGNSKGSYSPVSILPNMFKIFERCIFRQLYSFVLEFLSKYQCSFRKGYSTQVEEAKSLGALLTDLSKAFDYLCHEILLAKRHAY